MSSNAYNQYNYPYQQSSAQQHPAYQTAPASNNVAQSSRQYQPPTTQAQNYISYQSQPYANQSNGYGNAQGNSWNNSSHGGARETTSQAAEVLHNMSNPSYTATSTAANNQAGFTATHATSSHSNRFGTGSSHSPQVLAQQNHAAYGQSQARPHSVNNNRTQQVNRALPSPGMVPPQAMYNQQPQRTTSPAQPQYNTAPASDGRGATMKTVPNQQYGSYGGQQLPSVGTLQSPQSATPSGTYSYGTEQLPPATMAPHTPSVSMADTYHTQGTTTVDPMAVYDPWPEYQRKQAEKLAKEHAARAEEERVAEERRKAEEQKKEEERKRQEEENNLRQRQPDNNQNQQQLTMAEVSAAAPASDTAPGDALEAEIRAMMAKMRELNSKDPALLARIWEEERKAKAPKSSTAQSKTAPQAAAAQPTQPARMSTPQSTKTQEHTVPRETANVNTPKLVNTAVAQAVPVGQASMTPINQAQTTATRPTGNTVWPPERKVHVANAAASYLNSQNSFLKIRPGRVLDLLNGNPSYIQLCEQLEQMSFKLDRAAFARSLLAAVPDVNSKSRIAGPPPTPTPVQKPQVPPAVMKNEVSTPVAPSPQHAPAPSPSRNGTPNPAFQDSATPADHLAPTPVAEMVPIKPELRKPANKEEAARKRNLSDLVDLTQLSEDEDMGPPSKKLNTDSMYTARPSHFNVQEAIEGDKKPSTPNFPMADISSHTPQSSAHPPVQPSRELGQSKYVELLDRKKALRRNTYNPATIARDVLLACGRHPSQRNLNQHLDVLRTTLPQVTFDADLSTIRWDLIDPGNPPPNYFKDKVEDLTQDADEDESDDEDHRPRPRSPSKAIGGEGGAQATAQALPEAINPFKQKRRGRPPKHSLSNTTSPVTPKYPKNPAPMSSSASRPGPNAGSVGYAAFRSATQYGPDGQPLPKKKGRPVGWRKAIHGSAAAQAGPAVPAWNIHTGPLNKHQPAQPSPLHNVGTGQNDATIRIDSRSPSVADRAPQFQSYKCKWLNCKADLHNLDTLKKHVYKVHRKATLEHTLECLWGDCGKEATGHDPLTNVRLERHQPHSFDLESNWRSHIQQTHLDPLSWELGDGPASGLSDSHDSEAYLSDAQGRQVTPRITVDPKRVQALTSSPPVLASASRGRGRPPKRTAEEEARDAHERLVALKKRVGGPGMDRGGATLVNDKRRRGLIEGDETEEEIVNMED